MSKETYLVEKSENKVVNLFSIFNQFQKTTNDFNLLEVSIRQGQVMFIFEADLIPLEAFNKLTESILQSDGVINKFSTIGFMEENPILVIDISQIQEKGYDFEKNFQILTDTIFYAAENVCRCPSLEIIFSSQYIKCFLDKPGITLKDVKKYETMFGLEGTLELFGQRPYLLLINDAFEE